MSDKMKKPIVLVRVSERSMEEAIRKAMERAQHTLGGLDSIEVIEVRGLLREGKVRQFRVKMKVGFRMRSEEGMQGP